MWNAKNKVWNKVICSILTNFVVEMYFSSEEKYIFANIHLLSFGESSGRLDPIDDGNNTVLLPIENMIHVIRGQLVMIDIDPA